ncbi:hypothetical protein BC792_12711 [Sphingobacterium allocomposti]|uniref:Uncharacterized protein n=1 Tax=Sphingobacterium allocomposti TaxID=415956 RepID=A0A5S5D055_9SPHI|nr:hypothetical protein BC792_12711 [Sphingobacterium composti Yoo et al. 2007 non Ten et al. 2007]
MLNFLALQVLFKGIQKEKALCQFKQKAHLVILYCPYMPIMAIMIVWLLV